VNTLYRINGDFLNMLSRQAYPSCNAAARVKVETDLFKPPQTKNACINALGCISALTAPCARSQAVQNMPFGLADCSGMTCSTSQCSTIFPSPSSRKMSMPA
jgi:hypothetical protein